MKNKELLKERYSLRITQSVIDNYKFAVDNLPINFKASALIEEYMKSIIEANNKFEQTGKLDLNITIGNNKIFNLKTEGVHEKLI